jgi:hypothetical protein
MSYVLVLPDTFEVATEPSTSTVPLLWKNVQLLVLLPLLLPYIVKLPETLNAVRVDVIWAVYDEPEGVTALPTLTETQFIVPAPLIVQALFAVAELFKVTEVVTVSTTLTFTASVPEVLLKAMELHVLLPSTVNVNPVPIIISSVVKGIVPPGQGASGVVELQFPLPVVVIEAKALIVVMHKSIMKINGFMLFAIFFMCLDFVSN